MSDDSDSTPPIEPGTVLAGKYRVERLLASGGMGSVVKARHEILEQDVAIKVMRPEIAKNVEFSQRFLREARAAAKIASDYVARVTDVDLLDDGTPFMVMEYLEGEDLASLLDRSGKLPIGEAVDYMLQALSGLEAAHKLGIVHRDLKPSNLFLAERGHAGARRVKVLDFGISKVLEDRAPSGLKAGATTAYNAFLGTPRYMSPEQVSCAKDVDARTDLWSMGLILYNLLTGLDPFESDTFQGVFARILTEPVTTVREHRSDCPAELEKIVLRCLERDRKQRVATAGELMRALAPFASTRVRASLLDPNEVANAAETRVEIVGSADADRPSGLPTTVEGGAANAKHSKDAPTTPLRPITPAGASAEVADVAKFSAERTEIAEPVAAATGFQQASTQAPITAPAAAPARGSRAPLIAAVIAIAAVGIGVFSLRGSSGSKGDGATNAASAQATSEPSAVIAAALVPSVVATASAEEAPSAAPSASASAEAAPSVMPAGTAEPSPSSSASAQAAAKPHAGAHAPHPAAGAKKPSSSRDDILGSRN